jgi:3-phenylpropionate/trans-cinnamate dioxygenase ferredoxin subunit
MSGETDSEQEVKMARHRVGKAADVPVGRMKTFRVGDQTVLVFHLEDGFYGTQSTCTHVFAPMSRGKLVDGDKIQCPFHRARFDVRTGEVVHWANFPPGIQLLNVVRWYAARRP